MSKKRLKFLNIFLAILMVFGTFAPAMVHAEDSVEAHVINDGQGFTIDQSYDGTDLELDIKPNSGQTIQRLTALGDFEKMKEGGSANGYTIVNPVPGQQLEVEVELAGAEQREVTVVYRDVSENFTPQNLDEYSGTVLVFEDNSSYPVNPFGQYEDVLADKYALNGDLPEIKYNDSKSEVVVELIQRARVVEATSSSISPNYGAICLDENGQIIKELEEYGSASARCDGHKYESVVTGESYDSCEVNTSWMDQKITVNAPSVSGYEPVLESKDVTVRELQEKGMVEFVYHEVAPNTRMVRVFFEDGDDKVKLDLSEYTLAFTIKEGETIDVRANVEAVMSALQEIGYKLDEVEYPVTLGYSSEDKTVVLPHNKYAKSALRPVLITFKIKGVDNFGDILSEEEVNAFMSVINFSSYDEVTKEGESYTQYQFGPKTFDVPEIDDFVSTSQPVTFNNWEELKADPKLEPVYDQFGSVSRYVYDSIVYEYKSDIGPAVVGAEVLFNGEGVSVDIYADEELTKLIASDVTKYVHPIYLGPSIDPYQPMFFTVTPNENYKLKSVGIEGKYKSFDQLDNETYKVVFDPEADLLEAEINIETENVADKVYKVTFVTDEHSSVEVLEQSDKIEVIKLAGESRDIKFKINFDDGYKLDKVSIDGMYEEFTKVEGTTYLVTGITADTTITATSKVGVPSTDKEALKEIIDKAKEEFDNTPAAHDGSEFEPSEQWVPFEDANKLADAINEAVDVYNNSTSAKEVNAEAEKLQKALEDFEKAKQFGTKESDEEDADEAALASLKELLVAADALLDETKVSADGTDIDKSEFWTTEDARDALASAVEAGKATAGREEPAAKEVSEAISHLQSAIAEFNSAKKMGTKEDEPVSEPTDTEALDSVLDEANELTKTKISEDGKDVDPDEKWVSSDDMSALKKAISEAQSVRDNDEASQEDVDEAVAELEKAVSEFKEAMQDGTKESSPEDDEKEPKEQLDDKLAEAEDLLDETAVSEDGTDVEQGTPWVDKATAEALEEAIASAEAIRDSEDASDDEINEALDNLDKAINEFKDAMKDGSKEPDEPVTVKFNLVINHDDTVTVTVVEASDDINISLAASGGSAVIKIVAKDGYEVDKVELDGPGTVSKTGTDEWSVSGLTADAVLNITTKKADTEPVNPPSDDEQKTEAKKAEAQTLINQAEKDLAGLKISKDGTDVAQSDKWITQENADKMANAIKEAKSAVEKGSYDDLVSVINKLKDTRASTIDIAKAGTKPAQNNNNNNNNNQQSQGNTSQNSNRVNTGDSRMIVFPVMTLVAALAICGMVFSRRKEME